MKHALRSLVRSPGFTAIAILTLALGIGVNTSMFSVLRTVVIRALPYAHPDRLVHLHRSGNSGQDWPHSVANFVDLHAQQTVFEHLAAVQGATFNLALPGEPADRLRGYRVSSEFFSTLGVPPALGRFFTAAEDRPGHDTVAVLSHRFWQTRFAGDASIVGREIRLDGKTVTVIGVMPPSFEDPLLWGQADLWQPIAFSDSQRANRRSNYLRVIAKMKPGLSLAQADAGLKAAWAPLVAAHPENAQTSLRIEPLAYGSRIDGGPISWFMFALAGLVLLIACANLANLQFARTAARARELAVRASLGATRTQLMRAVLVESLALAVVGGALGVLLALWCNDLLGRQVFIPPATVGIDIPLDYRVLAFALAASTLAGVGFGLFPAWLAARTNVSDALKQGGPAFTASHAQLRVRHLLIVAEVTLAVVLLSTASIFLHGLHRATQRDPGWRVDGLLTASLSIQTPKGTDTAEQRSAYRRAFVQQLEEQLAALPGVEQVGVGTMLPTYGLSSTTSFLIEGQPEPAPGSIPQAGMAAVTPNYFSALNLPLIDGRAFTAADRVGGPAVTIINETMARAFFPGESAIGKRLRHPDDPNWREIVGVVRAARPALPLGPPEVGYQLYLPYAQNSGGSVELAIRAPSAADTLAPAIRRVVANLQTEQAIESVVSLRAELGDATRNTTLMGWMLAAFAALGLVLAALGLYAVIAHAVVHRTREIGIRIALGAQTHDVLTLVAGQGLRLTLIGAVLGLAGTFAIVRVLTSILPGLAGDNALTLTVVIAVLFAVAALACWLPARRATKVSPLTALRSE